ncbi:MAG: polymer-forming cytoskeletal protein [Hyphomicrobiaceae bacterium]|nr:polymer-forming cytoskeletal protein [Hyphomicrobiaceae bacterium]
MNGTTGHLVVNKGTTIKGDIRNCRHLEVAGNIEGDLVADHVVVHPDGLLKGNVRADGVEVNGVLDGEVTVRGLLRIGSGGSVTGQVRYGQLAIDAGGNLVADVRNIPPRLAGDHVIEVTRGKSAGITVADLQAIDPDDPAENLTFSVVRPTRGFVAKSSAPGDEITSFTQADINGGGVIFVHDGSDTARASFDVVCTDGSGATSGAPQTIRVDVRPA